MKHIYIAVYVEDHQFSGKPCAAHSQDELMELYNKEEGASATDTFVDTNDIRIYRYNMSEIETINTCLDKVRSNAYYKIREANSISGLISHHMNWYINLHK